MSGWDNSNSGALFKESEKKGDSYPDYRGKTGFSGTQFWSSGWIKDVDGKKQLSLSFNEVDGDASGSGTLSRNERKNSERQPDFVGVASVDGTEYQVAGWKRTAKSSGKEFISVKVEPPRDAPQPVASSGAGQSYTSPDDDIPF